MEQRLKSPRHRLMVAATALFQDQGFHATGIDAVLLEAKAAKASLYQHFSSKDQLITDVLRLKSRKVLNWLNHKLETTTGEHISIQIDALFEAYADWFAEENYQGCLFTKAALEFPDQKHPAHKAAANHVRKLFCALENLCTEAGLPRVYAEHLLILLEGATAVATKTGAGRAPALRARQNAREILNI